MKPDPTVVVITGPIASGKSTIAREVARGLEGIGMHAAVIDLDTVHEMLAIDAAAGSDATWHRARREMARLANRLVAEGVTVVIAEGSFNAPRDRAAFADGLGPGANLAHVILGVSHDGALRRAQHDPTRGRSRDPDFLRQYFATTGHGREMVPATDLWIDTEATSVTATAASIVSFVQSTTSR